MSLRVCLAHHAFCEGRARLAGGTTPFRFCNISDNHISYFTLAENASLGFSTVNAELLRLSYEHQQKELNEECL